MGRDEQLNVPELTSKSRLRFACELAFMNPVGGEWLLAVLAGSMTAGQAATGDCRPIAAIGSSEAL